MKTIFTTDREKKKIVENQQKNVYIENGESARMHMRTSKRVKKNRRKGVREKEEKIKNKKNDSKNIL